MSTRADSGRLPWLASAIAIVTAVAIVRAAPVRSGQQATFKSIVDVVAVEVQVSDRQGRPIAGLNRDQFEVTIDGKRRRVVSADLIAGARANIAMVQTPSASGDPAVASPRPPGAARPIVVLAVDNQNFGLADVRPTLIAARAFLDRLPPDDLVGLYAYPVGPKVDPTTDRSAVVLALDKVVGQRGPLGMDGRHHFRPSELVDVSAYFVSMGRPSCTQTPDGRTGEQLVNMICSRNDPEDICESCRQQLDVDVRSMVLASEGQTNASAAMLRSLLRGLAVLPGRKTVVLVTGGLPVSDQPGGRPDVAVSGIDIGKVAAQSNVSLYTLLFDRSTSDYFSAESRRSNMTTNGLARDRGILNQWFDQLSGTAGGMLINVPMGGGEAGFDRILTELSAYYLLGVEPIEADRDGRTHQLNVKVTERHAQVRGRKWMYLPKRGATTALVSASPGSAATAPPSAGTPVAPPPPPPVPMPADVQSLADAYARGDYAAVERQLARAVDLATMIRGFRAADRPWPEAPRRTAAFALELALAGLQRGNTFARDEGVLLLGEYTALVRQPGDADEFECAWYRTQTAALEGLVLPRSTLPFVTRAVQRCPTNGRLALAQAVVTEQEWRAVAPSTPDSTIFPPGDAGLARTIVERYEHAMTFADAAVEARIRAAWFLHRTGNAARAAALVDAVQDTPADPYLRYWLGLVRGQIQRAEGRLDAAAAAYRDALVAVPGAQAARVALMTLLVERGDRAEAESLAQSVATTDPGLDPWWTFRLGDLRTFPAILSRLRELGR